MWQHRSSRLRKAEPQGVGHVIAPELRSQEGRARSPVTRGSAGAHLSKETRSGAVGHMMVLESTSTGMCDTKVQHIWQRVNTHHTPYLNLKLVCRVPDL
jgi:hypothetical protein